MRRSTHAHAIFLAISQLAALGLAYIANARPIINLWAMLLLMILAGCEEQPYDNSANTAPIPDAINTAGLDPSLTITYPQGNAEDSSAFIQVAENSPTVAQVKAQDVAGSMLIYRLQDGEDTNRFVIDENTGVLGFKGLPDWENPDDADSNNNYMVLWQVLSSTGEARSQFLVVQVTDLPD